MNDFEYDIDGDDVTIDLYIEGRWVNEIKVDKWELLSEIGARAIENHDDFFTFETYKITYPTSDDCFMYSEYALEQGDIEDYLKEKKLLWQD